MACSFQPVATPLTMMEELSSSTPRGRLPFVPHQGRPIVCPQGLMDTADPLLMLQEKTIELLNVGIAGSEENNIQSRTATHVASIKYPSEKSFAEKACSLTTSQLGTVLMSDQAGNVHLLRGLDALCVSSNSESERGKRSRDGEGSDATAPQCSRWVQVCDDDGSHTAGGWAGWCQAEFDPTSSDKRAIVAREYYRDIRLVDLETQIVVSHFLPSTYLTSIVPFPDQGPVVCCAESNCISVWDLRLNSNSGATKKAETTGTAQVAHIPGVSGGNLVVSGGEDRAVVIWDRRKWTKVKTEKNVLKYSIRTVAPVVQQVGDGMSTGIVVGAIDSEARVLDMSLNPTPPPAASNAASPKPQAGNSTDASAAGSPNTPLEGAFRQRLKKAFHCSGTWRGGFASHGSGAVGMSIANEVFLTQSL